ncbi:hypothetical protein L4C34_20065 [Vibrio profundum]|uniref:hypothetical protein n=1 Tax=Vibrio profundum TaxID=2910247 RepID=UPI003D1474CF
MEYNKHGVYKVYTKGHILFVEASGSWNQEVVEGFSNSVKDCVQSFQGRAWGSMFDVRLWELCTPEMWAGTNELTEWMMTKNYAFEAMLCSTKVLSMIIEHYRVQTSKLKREAFSDYDDALQWCLKQEQALLK